jgi:hypothetical protein
MEDIVWLIFSALATFRLAEMFVIDDGLFDVFANLRGWANNTPFDNGIRRNISTLLSCVHCIGIWFSIIFGVAFYIINGVTIFDAFVFTFAVAGLQSLLSNNFGRAE